LSPAHPELAESFAKVRLRNFEDLQLLGFVPRKLAEDKIRSALRADDDEVYRIASASTSAPSSSHCDCNAGGPGGPGGHAGVIHIEANAFDILLALSAKGGNGGNGGDGGPGGNGGITTLIARDFINDGLTPFMDVSGGAGERGAVGQGGVPGVTPFPATRGNGPDGTRGIASRRLTA
jgi:hypothetical protein